MFKVNLKNKTEGGNQEWKIQRHMPYWTQDTRQKNHTTLKKKDEQH